MKIIKASATIKNEQWLSNALEGIEYAARISHRSEDGQIEGSAKQFVQRVVIDRGDWSVVEHITAQVEFVVDRGITHEIVRHRLFSYTQESTRFVNYKKKMPPLFIYPQVGIECKHCLAGNEPITGSVTFLKNGKDQPWVHQLGSIIVPCEYDPNWLTSIDQIENTYKQLLDNGWRPQEARSILPNALSSKLLMTGITCPRWRALSL